MCLILGGHWDNQRIFCWSLQWLQTWDRKIQVLAMEVCGKIIELDGINHSFNHWTPQTNQKVRNLLAFVHYLAYCDFFGAQHNFLQQRCQSTKHLTLARSSTWMIIELGDGDYGSADNATVGFHRRDAPKQGAHLSGRMKEFPL